MYTQTHTHIAHRYMLCVNDMLSHLLSGSHSLQKKTSARSSIAYRTAVTSCSKPFPCITVQNTIEVQRNYNTANFKASITHTVWNTPLTTVTPLKTVGDERTIIDLYVLFVSKSIVLSEWMKTPPPSMQFFQPSTYKPSQVCYNLVKKITTPGDSFQHNTN